MVGRLETFPYEILIIWQRYHRTLNDDEAARFINDSNVMELGTFSNAIVTHAIRQTPILSEATAIARAAQSNRQVVLPVARSTMPMRQEDSEVARRRSFHRRLRAKRRWRKGGLIVRRTQIWAEENRANPTDAERRLETLLRGMFPQIGPIQVQWIFGKPSAPYILDFFIPRVRLGIEVDGSIHDVPEIKARDEQKLSEAQRTGITLRRISNADVLNSSPEIIQAMVKTWYADAAREELIRQRRPR